MSANEWLKARIGEILDESAREHGLGATGRYPHGRIGALEDQGELKVGVTALEGKVVVNFGKAVSWIALTPADVRSFAALLLARAERIEKGDTQ